MSSHKSNQGAGRSEPPRLKRDIVNARGDQARELVEHRKLVERQLASMPSYQKRQISKMKGRFPRSKQNPHSGYKFHEGSSRFQTYQTGACGRATTRLPPNNPNFSFPRARGRPGLAGGKSYDGVLPLPFSQLEYEPYRTLHSEPPKHTLILTHFQRRIGVTGDDKQDSEEWLQPVRIYDGSDSTLLQIFTLGGIQTRQPSQDTSVDNPPTVDPHTSPTVEAVNITWQHGPLEEVKSATTDLLKMNKDDLRDVMELVRKRGFVDRMIVRYRESDKEEYSVKHHGLRESRADE